MRYLNCAIEIFDADRNVSTTRLSPMVDFDEQSPNGGPRIRYIDGFSMRSVPIVDPTSTEDTVTGFTSSGSRITVRPITQFDFKHIDDTINYPVPKSVVAGMLTERYPMTPTLSAIIDNEGDVLTLMLMTNEGAYLRFSNAWHYLDPNQDPDPIDGYDIALVTGSAVSVFDEYDTSGKTASIAKYELADGETYVGPIRSIDSLPTTPQGDMVQPVMSAASVISRGTSIYPVIASVDDIDRAIEAAMTDPSIRWYVEKRVRALAPETEIPWSM